MCDFMDYIGSIIFGIFRTEDLAVGVRIMEQDGPKITKTMGQQLLLLIASVVGVVWPV